MIPAPTRLTDTRMAQLLPPPTPVGQGGDSVAKVRYDGGPTVLVPLPPPDASSTPARIDPAEEYPISVPTAPKPVNKYPAYGEKR